MVVGLRNLNSAHLLIWWQIKPPIAIATTTTAPKNDWIYWETQQRRQKLMTKRRVVYSWQSWVGKDEPKEEKKRINGKQRERISSFSQSTAQKLRGKRNEQWWRWWWFAALTTHSYVSSRLTILVSYWSLLISGTNIDQIRSTKNKSE